MQMQQRYYDPHLGVFLSVDPVTAYSNPIGQFHRYRYASNNPYRFTDPDGRQSESVMDRRYVYSRLSAEQASGIDAQHNDIGEKATAGMAAGATEVVGAKGLGVLAKGLRAFRSWRAARTAQAPPGIANQTTQQLQRSQRSLQENVAEHLQKLDDYKRDPDSHDNTGALANAPNKEIRQQIIDCRIRALEGQIDKNLGELKKVTSELSKRQK